MNTPATMDATGQPLDGSLVDATERIADQDQCRVRRDQRPIHIAHISLGTGMGGMEKLLLEFARHADTDRFKLSFISLQSCGCLADLIEAQQCRVWSLNKAAGLRPLLVIRLAAMLSRVGVDVVHTHNTAAMVYGVPAAKLARIRPIIHTRHGQRANSTRRQTRLFKWLARFTDQVVSVSKDSQQLTISEGVSATKAAKIVNGIDLHRFTFQPRRPEGPVIVVARLSPEKDIATLLHAVAAVNRQRHRPQSPCRLQIVGDGPLRKDLERLSYKLNLQGVVRFLGYRHDVARLLADASMFVLPSLTEGISLTLLEAMARGVPVIATEVGGNPEVITNNRTGLLVPSGDADCLALAIQRLFSDWQFANRISVAARQEVEQRFDVTRMVKQYERLYRENSIS